MSLDKIISLTEKHAIPCITITPTGQAPTTPWGSKIGGMAYWPDHLAYPINAEGHKLLHLATINFAECPPLDGYPTAGVLQFFISDDDCYGLGFTTDTVSQRDLITNPEDYRVVYHANPDELHATFVDPESEEGYHPASGEYALTFARRDDPLAPTDYRFDRLLGEELPNNQVDALWEQATAAGSKIGGFANFTQEDPRRHELQDEEWLLLLQIDTVYTDEVEIMWGDSGVGHFFITPQALQNMDFSQVWYNWDCS